MRTKARTFAVWMIGVILVAGLVAAYARPPRPHPVRAAHRAAVRHARHVRRHRRLVRHRQQRAHRRVLAPRARVALRRGHGHVVVVRDGHVVRHVARPVVIRTVKDLEPIPALTLELAEEATTYKVTGVGDDFTVAVAGEDETYTVRLIGVEPVSWDEGGGDEGARAFFENLLVGELVYVEADDSLAAEDEAGHAVAYLYRAPDRLLLNLELIPQGYAAAASHYEYEYQKTFLFYEGVACSRGRGVWGQAAGADPSAEDAAGD